MRCGFALGLLLCTSFACAAVVPQQWTAAESWPGGSAYDARLDRTVQMWGAGISLADAFARVRQQTGIEIGFSPPGTGYERVCVNLFLNPKRPPTIRDLLVQLAWVTECGFGYSAEGEAITYSFLAGRLGVDLSKRLEEQAEEARQQIGESTTALDRELRARTMDKLPEAIQALGLSRAEAVERYRGKDDLMLATLLDPGRRATLEFLASLRPDQIARLRETGQVDMQWSEVSGAQRAILGRSITAQEAGDQRRRWGQQLRGEEDAPPPSWSAEAVKTAFYVQLEFRLWAYLDGTVATSTPDPRRRGASLYFRLAPLTLCGDPAVSAEAMARAEADLQRALGQTISRYDEDLMVGRRQMEQQRLLLRRGAEEQLAHQCQLSEEVEKRLSSVHLPMRTKDGWYTLWQVQEGTAAATGLHVVSDCFRQGARNYTDAAKSLPPADADSLTALEALRMGTVCLTPAEYAAVEALENPAEPNAQSWQWGSAGQFLRFRSAEGEMWRGAFLPEETWQTLRGWMDKALPDKVEAGKRGPTVVVPLELRAVARVLSGLSTLQVRAGGLILYGDPTDPYQAYRHELAAALLVNARVGLPAYRLLSQLNGAQWERLQGKGLIWGMDTANLAPAGESEEFWSRCAQGDALWLTTAPRKEGTGLEYIPTDQAYWLEVTRDERPIGLYAMRRTWSARYDPVTYLPRPVLETP